MDLRAKEVDAMTVRVPSISTPDKHNVDRKCANNIGTRAVIRLHM